MQLERLVKPRPVNYRSRRREIAHDNTEPHQNATNKRKIHTHLRTTEKETKLTTSTLTNLGTCTVAGPMILPKNANQSIYTHTILHTHCKQKTCSGLTHTSRADDHSTPNQNPYPYVQKKYT
jgi:hypothetical protein